MLLDVRELAVGPGPEDIAAHFAEFVGRGLMLVGPPNVGKVCQACASSMSAVCVCVCVCVCVLCVCVRLCVCVCGCVCVWGGGGGLLSTGIRG
jgi:hypothetical protein